MKHMADISGAVVSFVIALVISAVIIWLITKVLGEREGIGTALLAALIGTVVYTVVYYFLDTGLLASIAAGIVWLLVLKALYRIGWLKALIIAFLIWIVTAFVGIFLPTLSGPL